MIVLIFSIAFAAAWLHWSFVGWAVIPGLLSVYVAAYLATLLTAICLALRSRETEPIWCAVTLAAYFLAGHVLWGAGASLEARAIEHLGFAAATIVLFHSRASLLIAGCFLAMFLADLAAVSGALPPASARPRTFLAWSHPDVLALLGHGASIILGLWAEGGRLSAALRRPALVSVHR